MAFRFQRRITLLPGLRLNLSKSGVGLSAGVRGASASIGSRGVYTHAGIPGTGLSYRKKINPKAGRSATSGRRGQTAGPGPSPQPSASSTLLEVRVQESGDIEIRSADGVLLSDAETRFIRRNASSIIRKNLAEQAAAFNEDLLRLTQAHLEIPPPRVDFSYRPSVFREVYPTLPTPQPIPFWTRLWPPGRRRIEKENQMQDLMHQSAVRGWEERRVRFNAREGERARCWDRACAGDLAAMEAQLRDHFSAIPWPRQTEIDFDLGQNERTIAIDLDLASEAEMPTVEWTLPARLLKLTPKPLSEVKRRHMYRDYVHATALRVAGEVIRHLPTIDWVLLSGYTQGVDRATGRESDLYLYSLIVDRESWTAIDFDQLKRIDPVEALARFEHRREMSKTGLFKEIEPFTLKDLETRASAAESSS
jgi:hypothetical protein